MVSELTGFAGENDESSEDEYEEYEEDVNDDYGTQDTAYLDACDVLGLEPPFTQSQFKAAYRRAISAVHPDRGGTTQQAQCVNEARARILERAPAFN